jgi:hypothetical protein
VAVQGPAGASDEFVELYNPTDQEVDITGWKMQYKSATGDNYTGNFTISAAAGSTTVKIAPHGYFLLGHNNYAPGAGEPAPDRRFGFSLAATGGHIRIGPASLGNLPEDSNKVDKLAYGTGNSPEGTAAPDPEAAPSSFERKAGPDSTATSMGSGGADELKGNGQDTDNNANDFVIRPVRQPQSSTSPVEL